MAYLAVDDVEEAAAGAPLTAADVEATLARGEVVEAATLERGEGALLVGRDGA